MTSGGRCATIRGILLMPGSYVVNSGILLAMLELSPMHTSVKDMGLSFWTMSGAVAGNHP